MTHFTSNDSYQPKDIYSPSLRPQAAKSNEKTVTFNGNKYFKLETTSHLDDEFPCKYITHGNILYSRSSS